MVFVLMAVLPFSVRASRVASPPVTVSAQKPQSPSFANSNILIEIRADAYGLPLADHEITNLYEKPSVFLQANDQIHFDVLIEEEGAYTLAFEMAAPEAFINAPEGQLMVDGAFPSADTQRIVFPVYYQNTSDTFPYVGPVWQPGPDPPGKADSLDKGRLA